MFFKDIINIYFKISKKLDKVYNDFKGWTSKFSNKFDVEIIYVFNVGIIRIISKLLFIGNNLFSFKFVISIFGDFLFFTYFFEFALCFPFFSQQKLPS